MKIKIKGTSLNTSDWKVFFDDKEVEGLTKIKFDIKAGEIPTISFETYADVEIDLDDIQIFTTSKKEVLKFIRKIEK